MNSYKTEKPTKKFRLPDDSRFKFPSKKEKLVEFNVSQTNFPELSENNISKVSPINSIPNFRGAVQKEVLKEEVEENTLPPGWVGMKWDKANHTIVRTQGEIGPYFKKSIIQTKREEDPRYIMSRAVNQMIHTWEIYKYNYEETFGEGAYEEVYQSKNIYEFEEEEDEYEEGEENDQDTEIYEYTDDYY